MSNKIKIKAQRQQWWNSLSLEEKDNYVKKRQEIKAKKRGLNPVSKCPVFSEVNEQSRQQWLDKIHKKNPWINPNPEGTMDYKTYLMMEEGCKH